MAEPGGTVGRRAGASADLLLVARAEWRTRWRSHLVVVALAAVTVAAGVAALTAATRSQTAFERLRHATAAADLSFQGEGEDGPEITVDAVATLDGVEAAGVHVELFVRPKGSGYTPDYDLYATVTAGGAVDRPLVVRGRAARPDRAGEVLLSEPLAKALGAGVGARIALESMTSAWVDKAFSGQDPGPPDGPEIDALVVGLARSPADFGRWKGMIHLTPAFLERYGDRIRTYSSVEARLTDAGRRLVETRDFPHLDGIEVGPSPFGNGATATDGLRTMAAGLRLLAAVALAAGAVATALSLTRLSRLTLRDRRTLMALGWTEGRLVGVVAVVFAPWLAAGAGLGLVGGVLGSPSALVGLARRVDPAPGSVELDGGVVLAGLAGSVVLGVAMVLVAGRLAASGSRSRRAGGLMGGSGLPGPSSLVLGLRQALLAEPARGGRTSRGAVAVVAAGVAGAVAALMVSASILRLQNDPSLSGRQSPATRVIDSGEELGVYDRALPLLEDDERVAMLVGMHVTFDIDVPGSEETSTLVYDIRRGDPDASVVRGRVATRPDEVALGPATRARIGRAIGDEVELRGPAGSHRFRIVGEVLFPEGDFQHDDGVALAGAGADWLVGDIHDEAQIHQVAFRWRDGIDAATADRELEAAGLQPVTTEDTLNPPEVSNLGAVRTLPLYLAVFVGLLAVVTLGHALVTGVRVRRHELGTLRALGMTAPACAAMVEAQALTMAIAGLVAGLPLGLVAGRQVWRLIAEGANVVVVTVAPWSALGVLVATAVAAAAVVAAAPAWQVLRLRPASVLRTE